MRRLLFCAVCAAVMMPVPAAPDPVTTNEISLDTVLDASPVASSASALDTSRTHTYDWVLDQVFSTYRPGLQLIFK